MATMTAQILIGRGHPNDDGINTSHCLYLSENSRPALLLIKHDLFASAREKPLVWIPTLESFIDDAILMIAALVLKDQEIVQMLSTFGVTDLTRVEVYQQLQEEQRQTLYQMCRDTLEVPKLIITVFYRSSLRLNLEALAHYKMDIEVCRPVYTQLYSNWTQQVTNKGELTFQDTRF